MPCPISVAIYPHISKKFAGMGFYYPMELMKFCLKRVTLLPMRKWRVRSTRDLQAEDGAEFFPEQQAAPDQRCRQEGHGPHAQRRGYVTSRAQKLEQLEDGFGDGHVACLLRKHQAVADLQHTEGECQQRAGDQVRKNQRQGDALQGCCGGGAQI
jgi:hypothetical protein